MTDFANWNDTHFDTMHALADDGYEDDGWSERYDYTDEEFSDEGYDFCGEDSFLDSYWEMQNEFWEG